MIISTKKGTPKEELEKIVDKFENQGLDVTLITGKDYNVFGLVGDTTKIDERDVLANPWIDNVTRVSAPYKRANRLFHPADSVIDCGGVKIGSKEKIAVMAGPCSIENAEQALRIAQGVKAGGAALFRGGAYKPRTSPYAFQGLETEGILDMVKAREATGLPIVSELMSEDRIPEFEEYVDVVQIGARNMQNFQLLKAVGKMHKPVLLKRGLCNTIEEWIMSAEYIMAGGNEQVIFCERGIRTFEKYTRNTLDLSAVPIIHEKTHLPIVVDPSHATGKANLVEPMMIAAVAAGADGLEVEVHYDPQHAWSDGAQCLTPDAFGVHSRWLDETTLLLPGGQQYHPCDYNVEGDYSQAAFPAVLGAVCGGVTITGLAPDTLQGDAAILDILRRCGAVFTRKGDSVTFAKAPLHGVDIDLADCPDLGPVLMVLGLLCEGTTVIRNAERLRLKESDRIAAMEAELRACGGVLESDGGTITVHGCAGLLHAPAAPLHGHNDHRVVMSLAVLAAAAGLPLTVDDAEAIQKSWPGFFADAAPLGVEVEDA